MANRRFEQFFYTLHNYPVLLDCQFTVAQSDAAGLGITGLRGPGIQSVFMNTSATVAGAAAGNPLPQAGNIIVKLQDNYTRYYGGFERVDAPNTGSDLTTLSVGVVYAISVLGASTLVQWQAAGLPVGIVPAVGAAFVAKANIAGGGMAKAIGNSNIDSIEGCGNPQITLKSTLANRAGIQSGSYVIFQCLKSDALQQPTDGAVIHLAMYFGNTRILNKGE